MCQQVLFTPATAIPQHTHQEACIVTAALALRPQLRARPAACQPDAPAAQAIAEVEKRFKEGMPLLDPAEDMGIRDSALRKAQRCAGPLSVGVAPRIAPVRLVARRCTLCAQTVALRDVRLQRW